MKIVVLDGYTANPGDLSWEELEKLGPCEIHDRTPGAEVAGRARDAEVLLTNKTVISRATIAALPKLRYIGVLATGFNVVDIDAAKERGIPVCNIPEYGTPNVAQAVFALMLELTNRTGHHADTVRAGCWSISKDFCYWDGSLIELNGLTLGLVGYGRIAQATARIAHAFGMKVLATRRRSAAAPIANALTTDPRIRAPRVIDIIYREATETNPETVAPATLTEGPSSTVSKAGAPEEKSSAGTLAAFAVSSDLQKLFAEHGTTLEFVDLDRLFAESDFVSLHCPLTPETKEMVNASRLGLMKPSAYLINTARGALVNEQDLADALNQGRIAGAGLDVLSTEPPPASNPLISAKNCVITPHIAWATRKARARLLQVAVENIAAWIAGEPRNVVNPAA